MEIKDFIKARRKQLKMSLQTLGDAISYTPQAIARFENGKVKVGDLLSSGGKQGGHEV